MMTRETDIIKGRITKYMAQSAAKTTVLVSQFNISTYNDTPCNDDIFR